MITLSRMYWGRSLDELKVVILACLGSWLALVSSWPCLPCTGLIWGHHSHLAFMWVHKHFYLLSCLLKCEKSIFLKLSVFTLIGQFEMSSRYSQCPDSCVLHLCTVLFIFSLMMRFFGLFTHLRELLASTGQTHYLWNAPVARNFPFNSPSLFQYTPACIFIPITTCLHY